jgi:hypothetical protein
MCVCVYTIWSGGRGRREGVERFQTMLHCTLIAGGSARMPVPTTDLKRMLRIISDFALNTFILQLISVHFAINTCMNCKIIDYFIIHVRSHCSYTVHSHIINYILHRAQPQRMLPEGTEVAVARGKHDRRESRAIVHHRGGCVCGGRGVGGGGGLVTRSLVRLVLAFWDALCYAHAQACYIGAAIYGTECFRFGDPSKKECAR